MASVAKIFSAILVCMVVAAPMSNAATSCSTVSQDLTPCYSYLMSGGSPSSSCCSGIKTIWSGASTTADRRAICNCLKELYNSYKDINVSYAENLLSACGYNVPYKISPSTSCSSIN